jgi:hypothetical protein
MFYCYGHQMLILLLVSLSNKSLRPNMSVFSRIFQKEQTQAELRRFSSV